MARWRFVLPERLRRIRDHYVIEEARVTQWFVSKRNRFYRLIGVIR